MDNVSKFIDLINGYAEESLDRIPLTKYGEYNGVRYVYYSKELYDVEFNLVDKLLIIKNLSRDEVIEYDILYPRFVTNSHPDSKLYFHFIFSIERDEGQAGVVVIRGNSIREYLDLYGSEYRIVIESEDDYFSKDKILEWQEIIYRDLGLGMGIDKLPVSEDNLLSLGMTREEFDFALNHIIIDREINCLSKRLGRKRINKVHFMDIMNKMGTDKAYSLKELSLYGVTESEYTSIELLQKRRITTFKLERAIISRRRRTRRSLYKLIDVLRANLYYNKIKSLEKGFNMDEVLSNQGIEIDEKDIQIYKNRLRVRAENRGLTPDEAWHLIYYHKRILRDALELEYDEEFDED